MCCFCVRITATVILLSPIFDIMMWRIKVLFLQSSILLICVSKVCGKNNLHGTDSGLDAGGISINDSRRHLASLTRGKKESGKKTMSGKGDKIAIVEEEAAIAKKPHLSGSEDVPKTYQYIEKASSFKTQKSRSSSNEIKQRKKRSRSRVMEVIHITGENGVTSLFHHSVRHTLFCCQQTHSCCFNLGRCAFIYATRNAKSIC